MSKKEEIQRCLQVNMITILAVAKAWAYLMNILKNKEVRISEAEWTRGKKNIHMGMRSCKKLESNWKASDIYSH